MPDFSEKQVQALTELYARAEQDITNEINRGLAKGNNVKYLQTMQKNVQVLLGELSAGAKSWSVKAINSVMQDAVKRVDKEVGAAGAFGLVNQRAAKVLAENAYARLEDVSALIGRRVNDIYREVALEVVREGVVGYKSWEGVARKHRNALAERGITGFRDSAGKEWNMRAYSQMVARTSTMEAHLEGTKNRLIEHGYDLIKVSSHSTECKLCKPWQGAILSLTGATPGYPTLEEAKSKGLFHPNCKHAYTAAKVTPAEAKKEKEKKGLEPVTFGGKIQAIKDRIEAEGGEVTESHLREAGRVFLADLKPSREHLRKAMDEADKAIEDLGYNNKWKEYSLLGRAIRDTDLSAVPYKTIAEARERRSELLAWMGANEDEYWRLKNRQREAQLAYKGAPLANAEELKSLLATVRKVGKSEADLKDHYASRSPMQKVISQAFAYYPTDWADVSLAYQKLKPLKRKRGYYSHYGDRVPSEIAISEGGESGALGTAIHELGHRWERLIPGIREREIEFYNRRTAGLPLEWMGLYGSGYRRDEKTRRDDFVDAYMGKDYGGSAYELVSMGFEMAILRPTSLWQDEEMSEWIYGMLALL